MLRTIGTVRRGSPERGAGAGYRGYGWRLAAFAPCGGMPVTVDACLRVCLWGAGLGGGGRGGGGLQVFKGDAYAIQQTRQQLRQAVVANRAETDAATIGARTLPPRLFLG
jgi:hypothetical protein